MAQSSLTYFNNATPEATLFKGNIYGVDSSPKYDIGHRVALGDGRVFRYAQIGAATAAGLVVSQDVSTTLVVDTDNVVIAPASAVAVPGEVLQPGAIGSRYVELTLAAVVANQFAGGYFITTDDTGEGYTYRIKGNTATGDPAAGNIRLTLFDPLQVALDATTDICIVGSKYSDLKAADATDGVFAGVTCAAHTGAGWGFVQTKGIASVLTNGVVVFNNAVGVGAVAGSVAAIGAATTKQLGTVAVVGDDTGYSAIDLCLE